MVWLGVLVATSLIESPDAEGGEGSVVSVLFWVFVGLWLSSFIHGDPMMHKHSAT